MVDSVDKERIGISKNELVSMLDEEELKKGIRLLALIGNRSLVVSCYRYDIFLSIVSSNPFLIC